MTDSQRAVLTVPAASKETPAAPGKRVEEVRAQRRRRADTTGEFGGKLHVNAALLDHNQFAYRWINDSAGRIDELTIRDDWDIIRDPSIKDDANSEGAQVRQLVGSKVDGSPLYAYLCRKPIEFHKADRAKKHARTNELEKQIMRGVVKGPGALSTDNGTAYVPDGGSNSITDVKGTHTYKP
jgi:hypothetical protein